MKKILIALALILTLSSCEDWLSATSSTQFQAETIYKDKDGFLDALSGVYIDMGQSTLYGGYSTWQYYDLFVYPYDTLSNTGSSSAQTLKYSVTSVQNIIKSIWKSYYFAIASINIILPELEEKRNLFTNELEYKLYKGELLGLRAYLHFDLLRTFGLAGWTGENAGKYTVPYQTQYGKDAIPQRTYAETEKMLMADVDSALVLLAGDPVTGVVDENFEASVNSSGFWTKRNRHFNYYAALALKARICQWNNDYAAAADYAQQAIDGSLANLVSWINHEEFLKEYSYDARDWTFSTEHIFALDITGLYSWSNSLLIPLGNTESYNLPATLVENELYPLIDANGSLAGAEDIRGTAALLKYYSGSYICYKLYGSAGMKQKYRNIMPMIKLSEMYYILAENELRKGNGAGCLDYLNVVRHNRAVQDDLDAAANPEVELWKEYYREFLNEGQLLYWIRHAGCDNNPFAAYKHFTDAELMLPYPNDEINYGRNQEK